MCILRRGGVQVLIPGVLWLALVSRQMQHHIFEPVACAHRDRTEARKILCSADQDVPAFRGGQYARHNQMLSIYQNVA